MQKWDDLPTHAIKSSSRFCKVQARWDPGVEELWVKARRELSGLLYLHWSSKVTLINRTWWSVLWCNSWTIEMALLSHTCLSLAITISLQVNWASLGHLYTGSPALKSVIISNCLPVLTFLIISGYWVNYLTKEIHIWVDHMHCLHVKLEPRKPHWRSLQSGKPGKGKCDQRVISQATTCETLHPPLADPERNHMDNLWLGSPVSHMS